MKRLANLSSRLNLPLLALALFTASHLHAADTMESLIAGAKKEDELVFIAGAQTFGGRKGLAELETAFNKRYGLSMKISFAAGPDMNARAAAKHALAFTARAREAGCRHHRHRPHVTNG